MISCMVLRTYDIMYVLIYCRVPDDGWCSWRASSNERASAGGGQQLRVRGRVGKNGRASACCQLLSIITAQRVCLIVCCTFNPGPGRPAAVGIRCRRVLWRESLPLNPCWVGHQSRHTRSHGLHTSRHKVTPTLYCLQKRLCP
jgi:hypothetical protein